MTRASSYHEIAFQAACGGHIEYAEELRINHGVDASLLVEGAILGQHREYAEKLRVEHGVSLILILQNAINQGMYDYVQHLLSFREQDWMQLFANIDSTIFIETAVSKLESENGICPIGYHLIKKDQAITLNSGVTYDQNNIKEWFLKGSTLCPITQQEITAYYKLTEVQDALTKFHISYCDKINYVEKLRKSLTLSPKHKID